MIWKSDSGGPWGTGPRGGGGGSGGGPWGPGRGGGDGGRGRDGGRDGGRDDNNGRGGGGGGPGPRGFGPPPPNFEEMLRRSQDRLRNVMPGGFGMGTGLAVVAVAILVLWLVSGFYRVLPDEVGIVLRFGAYNRTAQPGLNYHLPSPIETVLRPSVLRWRASRRTRGARFPPRRRPR